MSESKKMSAGMMVAIVFGLLLTVILIGFGSLFVAYVSATNEGTQMESIVKQLNKDSENKLSTYTLKIKEMAQVPDMYTEQLKDVIKGTFEGRYGKDGSKAVVQFMHENNIQLDSKLFLNLQSEMVAGRNEFQISQTRKLEVCRNYENALGYFWKGKFLSFAGFPKIDLEKACQVVSDAQTKQAFETGIQEPIKLK